MPGDHKRWLTTFIANPQRLTLCQLSGQRDLGVEMAKPPHIQEFMLLNDARNAVAVPMQYLPYLGSLVITPGATATELSEMMQQPMDGISRTLRVLREDYEAVDSEADEKDARKKHFYLTPKGRLHAINWLKGRGIELTQEQIESIPVIVPVKRPRSRVRGGSQSDEK